MNEITFLVLEEIPFSLILGTDWIREADATIYYKNGKIWVAKRRSDEFERFLDNCPLHEPNEEALRIKTSNNYSTLFCRFFVGGLCIAAKWTWKRW